MKARLLTAAALALLSIGAESQVLYSVAGSTYAQNFDSLSNTPNNNTPAWTDNSTITGWYSNRTIYRISAGTVTNGDLYSFGTIGNTDRALGSIASTSVATIQYGVRLTNTTGQTLTSFTLGYTGEQWRDGGGSTAVPNTLTFDYSLSATAISTGAYTTVSALNFTGPINNQPSSGTALDGNAAANRVVINGVTVTGILWAPGADIWLRWTDPNDVGNDHGLAIDDLSFSAKPAAATTPEPGTLALMSAFGLSGFALLRRRAARK